MSVTSTVRIPTPTRDLNGSDKAAVLLLAMGKPVAGRLLKHFDPLELRLITRSAAELGAVPTPMLEGLVDEFCSHFSDRPRLARQRRRSRAIADRRLPPEQVADILSDVLGSSNSSMWEKLVGIPGGVFAAYLLQGASANGGLHPVQAQFATTPRTISAQLPRDFRNRVDAADALARAGARSRRCAAIEGVLQDGSPERHRAPRRRQSARAEWPTSSTSSIPSEMEDVLAEPGAGAPEGGRGAARCCSPSTTCSSCRPRRGRPVFDKIPTERVVLALQRHGRGVPRRASSPRSPRARAASSRASSRTAAAVPPREIAKARRAIADLVLEMAQRNEIEIATLPMPKRPSDDLR